MTRYRQSTDGTESRTADEPTDTQAERGRLSRRRALQAVGTGVASLGLLGGTAAASRPPCELDDCTRAFLLAEPPELPNGQQPPVQWDGETIAHDVSRIAVGEQVEGVPLSAPFAFDPIVTCVQAGTTVRWQWVNQKSVDPDIPVTVHHNVDVFQYDDECGYKEGSFVTSGSPVGFNPPEHEEPISFEHTFEEPGVYPYYCEPHGYPALPGLPAAATDDTHGLPPNLIGMRGAVIVTEKRGVGR